MSVDIASAELTVYPRWRGEHGQRCRWEFRHFGLSPLARGTPNNAGRSLIRCRFIPAGAGNTSRPLFIADTRSVYPRWRGEHFRNSADNEESSGLSPLARGTHLARGHFSGDERFIPAGAGNTTSATAATASPAVYPRWRGEHSKSIYLFYKAF